MGKIKFNSIIQKDTDHCFLCGANSNLEPLDMHHIFNKSYKKKSEAYGLVVYLHHSKCHIFGKDSVHQNVCVNVALQAHAQQKAMEYYGWTKEEFMQRFDKNYLD